MANTGVDLSLYGPASSDDLEGEGEGEMENGESDEEGEFEEDPVCS